MECVGPQALESTCYTVLHSHFAEGWWRTRGLWKKSLPQRNWSSSFMVGVWGGGIITPTPFEGGIKSTSGHWIFLLRQPEWYCLLAERITFGLIAQVLCIDAQVVYWCEVYWCALVCTSGDLSVCTHATLLPWWIYVLQTKLPLSCQS